MVISMRIINNEVLRKNIQSILKTNAVMLVVKDNAYGFGICNVVNIAKAMHVRDFAVKSVSEGTFIKMIYKEANVLILGKIDPKDIKEIKKYTGFSPLELFENGKV